MTQLITRRTWLALPATLLLLAGCGQTPSATTVMPVPAGPTYTEADMKPSSATPTPTTPAGCSRVDPAGNPVVGTARQGEYMGQQLPQGYDVYGSEAQVTAAIQKIYDDKANWACFQKFYPGASTVFKRKGRL